MSHVLVTGGAGFLGSHVAQALLQRGHQVTILDNLSGGFRANVPAAAEFVEGSVTDAALIDRTFESRRFDYVYHLAAYAAEGLSPFIKRFNYTNNIVGSVTLINAAVNHGVKGFVFTSSIAVYGSARPPMTEDTTPQPEDSYGIAKSAVEQELRATHSLFGLDSIIFRPHNVYGAHQNIGDRYRNVVGIFMNQILQGRPMTIFGDGQQTRAFSHVDDVAPLMAEAIERPDAWNQVFNIGADRPYSLNDLAERVAHAMGVTPEVVHLPARHEVLHAYASHDSIRRVFGDRPLTSLDDGLRSMASWVRTHGARTSAAFPNIEIRTKLPDAWITPDDAQPGTPRPSNGYHAVHLTHDPARAVVWQVVAEHLAPWIPAESRVVEIGAGYCDWINNVKARRRVAVDVWQDLPKAAASGVEPVVLDIATGMRSLGEGQFDVVLASNLLEHFEPEAASAVVADVAALLRPGGRFIVIQPNFRHAYRHYFDDYTHRTIFTDTSLATLLRSHGFRPSLVQPKFLPYSLRDTSAPISPWLVRAYLRSPIKPLAGQMLIVAERP